MSKHPLQQLDGLSALRCYAILWITIFHWQHYSVFWDDYIFVQFMRYAFIALDSFFILSGFIITYVYYDKFSSLGAILQHTPRFLIYRFSRIYPLHIITLGFFYIAYQNRWFFVHEPDLDNLLAQSLIIHGWFESLSLAWNYPSWSVSMEWLLYLLYPLCALCILRFKTIASNLLLFAVLSTILCLDVADRNYMEPVKGYIFYSWIGGEVTRALSDFLLGMVMCNLRRAGCLSAANANLLCLLLLASIASGILLDVPEYSILPLLPWFILTLSLIQGKLLAIIANKPALILGDASYSLYLWHTAVASAIWAYHTPDRVHYSETLRTVGFAEFMLVGFVILIPLSIASNYLIEKPCRNLLKHMLYKSPKPNECQEK